MSTLWMYIMLIVIVAGSLRACRNWASSHPYGRIRRQRASHSRHPRRVREIQGNHRIRDVECRRIRSGLRTLVIGRASGGGIGFVLRHFHFVPAPNLKCAVILHRLCQ